MYGSSSFLWKIYNLASVWGLWNRRKAIPEDEPLPPYALVLKTDDILCESVAEPEQFSQLAHFKGLTSKLPHSNHSKNRDDLKQHPQGNFSTFTVMISDDLSAALLALHVTSSFTHFVYLLKCHPSPLKTSTPLTTLSRFQFPSQALSLGNKDT